METQKRISTFKEYLSHKNISGAFILNPDHQFYLSGFKAISYSRPIVIYVNLQKSSMVVPGLEEVHANEVANVDEIYTYYEHPNFDKKETNHFQFIKNILEENNSNSIIGVDLSFTPGEIVRFINNLGFEVVDIGEKIEEMRYIKDDTEKELMKEAGKLVNVAVKNTINTIQVGATEMEIDAAGNSALFAETAKKHPNAMLDYFVMSPSGLSRSIMPHVFSNTRKIKDGDIIIHSRQVALNGYRAELERTIIVGDHTKEQKKAFDSARIAQQVALDYIKPGVKASDVDKKAREVFVKDGFDKYAVHRTGHGLGVSSHEKPFLRYDNHNLILEEGMVFSVEPGIYIPNVGGFRHSDTVIVTSNGCELTTDYSRELKDLNI